MNNTEEMWFPILEAPDYYISNHGRVMSSKSGKPKFCKTNISREGYHMAVLSVDGKRKAFRIHRLVAKYFVPNPDNLPQVDHIDRDKVNNLVTNLRWVTKEEQQKNRDYQGRKVHFAKLTENKVKEIRARRKKGDRCSAIAQDFDVSIGTVSRICLRQTWKHVD